MKRKQSGPRRVQIVTGNVTRHLLEQRIRDVQAAGLPYEIIDLDRRANQPMRLPESEFVRKIQVPGGSDVADDKIVELLQSGDLVITADIPLAARVVDKDVVALDPRGDFYSKENIRERLSIRDFMDGLRSTGVETGGPASFKQKDSQAFANQLDRFLTKHARKKNE